MKRRINILRSPAFTDPETNRVANVLYQILVIMLVGSTVLLYITSNYLDEISDAFLSIAIADVVIIINLILLRRGNITIPSITSPIIFIVAITYNIYIGQGVHDITIIAYPIAIILAGLFIGRNAAIYATAGSILGLSLIYWAERGGFRDPENNLFGAYAIDIWILSVFLIITAALVYIAVGNLRDTLEQLRKRESELEQLNQELENRVAARTKDLEKANQELESFSYSVSHDLRAPLRAISGFSSIIIQDFGQQLDAPVQNYLRKIADNTHQMGNLIDDLLDFSRLDRQPLTIQTISSEELKSIIDTIFTDLREGEPDRNVQLSIGNVPPIQGDPILVRQLFQNLLSNAYKYSRPRDVAEIKVGCSNESSPPIFYVQDNGVGFDMKYSAKLFGVFQRMHKMEDFEGTGVGLATVQRIVQRHGGRIWAEAKVDEGAKFSFTLSSE